MDMQLLSKAKFDEVTMPHVDGLFQTALQMTDSRSQAEAVVQETYDCARRVFLSRDENSDYRFELFRILIERLHDGGRGWFKVRRTPAPEQRTNPFLKALTQVPPAFREMILLVDCQGFSYQETAGILGVPVNAVAEGLVLGRKLLEFELAGRESEFKARNSDSVPEMSPEMSESE